MTISTRENVMPIEILLVEGSPGDVRLTREALSDAKVQNVLHVASDGIEATSFLWRQGEHANAPRPDLILLDLNQFLKVVKTIDNFWLAIVKLPSGSG
jgi:CheY-like chemotaxis protein